MPIRGENFTSKTRGHGYPVQVRKYRCKQISDSDIAPSAAEGEDNPSNQCIVGDVPNIFEGSESDHDGPYDGVTMGC